MRRLIPEITRPADPIEPEPNAVDGELPGIMVDSKADVAVVRANVVDPIGDDFAQFLVLEIVGVDLDRPTLRAIVAAAVLELAEQFLLLRVDRYHRLTFGLKLLDLGVDIFELGVAVGMFAAFLWSCGWNGGNTSIPPAAWECFEELTL